MLICLFYFTGILPGNAFGFNSDGKVFTINALYPRLVKSDQIRKFQYSRGCCKQSLVIKKHTATKQ